MYGPNEFGGPRTPTHAFRNRQCADGLGDDAADQRRGRGASLCTAKLQPCALISLQLRQSCYGNIAALGKSDGRGHRFAVGIETVGKRRTSAFDVAVRLVL